MLCRLRQASTASKFMDNLSNDTATQGGTKSNSRIQEEVTRV